MPYINVQTGAAISPEKEIAIKSRLGEAISLLPGKSENWLMINLSDNCRMWFKGENAQSAFIEVKSYGSINGSAAEKLTAAISRIISEELAIEKSSIYVCYSEHNMWGWNGNNF